MVLKVKIDTSGIVSWQCVPKRCRDQFQEDITEMNRNSETVVDNVIRTQDLKQLRASLLKEKGVTEYRRFIERLLATADSNRIHQYVFS